MKYVAFITALLSFAFALRAVDLPCAREDFSRFDPGKTRQIGKNSELIICSENGMHFRRIMNSGNLLTGFQYVVDNQKQNYMLHIRFRVPDGKLFGKLVFDFHIKELRSDKQRGRQYNRFILTASKLSFSAFKAEAFLTEKEHLPAETSADISQPLQPGIWYDLYLRAEKDRFSAVVKENEAVKGNLEAEIFGGSGTYKMDFHGQIDLSLIESFAIRPD